MMRVLVLLLLFPVLQHAYLRSEGRASIEFATGYNFILDNDKHAGSFTYIPHGNIGHVSLLSGCCTWDYGVRLGGVLLERTSFLGTNGFVDFYHTSGVFLLGVVRKRFNPDFLTGVLEIDGGAMILDRQRPSGGSLVRPSVLARIGLGLDIPIARQAGLGFYGRAGFFIDSARTKIRGRFMAGGEFYMFIVL